MLPFSLAALVAVILTAVGFVASGSAAPQATFKAGLVSDVGRFNDKGFNQNQLKGLNRAKKELKAAEAEAAAVDRERRRAQDELAAAERELDDVTPRSRG